MKYVTKSIFNFKEMSVEKTQQNKFILTKSVLIYLVMFFSYLNLILNFIEYFTQINIVFYSCVRLNSAYILF